MGKYDPQGYLTKGYALNEKRLKEQESQLSQLKQTVKLLGNVVERPSLSSDEATGLLKVITDYTYALDVLDQYDHQVLEIHDTIKKELFRINYREAMLAIQGLRKKLGGGVLFGNEKDESFQGSLAAIYQTFDGQYVYPSVRRRRPIFYISSSRTIRFLMAINVLRRFYSWGSWRKTVFSIRRTALKR